MEENEIKEISQDLIILKKELQDIITKLQEALIS